MNVILDNFLDANLKNNLFLLVKDCMSIALKIVDIELSKKKDGTIITKADKEIHSLITKRLSVLYPNIPVISEEGKFDKNSFLQNVYWLIDPIDGTSSFAKGFEGYTVNIALIKNGIPKLGIIGNPPTDTIWYGAKKKAVVNIKGIEKKIVVKKFIKDNLEIVISKNYDSVTKSFVDKIANANIKYYSSSIKFCKLAEGKADFYPRLHSISKWDIGAGDAILRAAGGTILNKDGNELSYNTTGKNTGNFFAVSSKKIWKDLIRSKLNI